MAMEVLSTLAQQSFELEGAGAPKVERDLRPNAHDSLDIENIDFFDGPGVLGKLKAFELRMVWAATLSARPPLLRKLAIGFSKLGNGWIYLLVGAVILLHWGLIGVRIIFPAGLNAALLHSLYPMLKRRFGRRRPFQIDPSLPSLLPTLDAHSFPSGHAMTLAGVLTPIVMMWPGAGLSAALVGAGVAWSRVATAHHYPSDVIAGTALGVGVGYPTTALFVTLWN
jgi:undecaprenyl-diphosphatase